MLTESKYYGEGVAKLLFLQAEKLARVRSYCSVCERKPRSLGRRVLTDFSLAKVV